jgi:uracil-DNA glycosylase family 4
MQPYGDNRKRVMFLGEGPGAQDDKLGKPWQGPAGDLVQGVARENGLDLFRDCVSLNSVNCRPMSNDGKNREPTSYEIACCRAKIVNPAIGDYSPDVIVLMGGSAVTSVLGPLAPESRALDAAISKWRGFTIPIPSLGAWVCPTYHPSYILREEKRPELDTIWRQDVKRALKLLDEPVPAPEDLATRVEVLRDEGAILRAIYAAHDSEHLSYDYETTGLNPSLHELVCASFATSPDLAYAFMMPKTGPIRGAWAKLMSDPSVGKISHNMKFEDGWTRAHFEVDEIAWKWDSMIAAHVVDSRVGICGLKLQGFINFGIQDWSTVIDPYLKSIDKKDPRAPNRIWEFIERYGEEDCLCYCGIDSLMAFRLAVRQMGIIGA